MINRLRNAETDKELDNIVNAITVAHPWLAVTTTPYALMYYLAKSEGMTEPAELLRAANARWWILQNLAEDAHDEVTNLYIQGSPQYPSYCGDDGDEDNEGREEFVEWTGAEEWWEIYEYIFKEVKGANTFGQLWGVIYDEFLWEQGANAREVPSFERLLGIVGKRLAAVEKEISALSENGLATDDIQSLTREKRALRLITSRCWELSD